MSEDKVGDDVQPLSGRLRQPLGKTEPLVRLLMAVRERAERGNQAAYLVALAQAPAVEPEPYDRLPVLQEGYV